ncbi:unnamed protein product [Vitrella brassicaformis CCMP3155]|uniref:Uncharacterized protein n=1 Tax=Vitrella brassicaformis (strain CCMP3155) TaxID=1169540 RepID=A0A0G4G433_VITBC|nr:unnamed protein product [Vitrella brassicaformis CCMP3155]|eukprot:CEM22845.1 unnamed protein product [Vitrella brassicaformis CCMP3155]
MSRNHSPPVHGYTRACRLKAFPPVLRVEDSEAHIRFSSIAAHRQQFSRVRLLNILKAEARQLKTRSETRGRGLGLANVNSSLTRRAHQYAAETHTQITRAEVNGLLSEAKNEVFGKNYFKDGIHQPGS